MTLYRQSFRVCSRGVSAPRQARVLRQRDSRSSNLHCEMPCPVFENLWHSFVSGTVDVRKFLEQIQIQQEDLQHRHKSLTMIAFSALEIPEKYYVNMMGVFRVLDSLWQVPQAASAVKLLLIGFTKTGAGTFNLANLLPEQEVGHKLINDMHDSIRPLHNSLLVLVIPFICQLICLLFLSICSSTKLLIGHSIYHLAHLHLHIYHNYRSTHITRHVCLSVCHFVISDRLLLQPTVLFCSLLISLKIIS